jgi:hypothetical protein
MKDDEAFFIFQFIFRCQSNQPFLAPFESKEERFSFSPVVNLLFFTFFISMPNCLHLFITGTATYVSALVPVPVLILLPLISVFCAFTVCYQYFPGMEYGVLVLAAGHT